MTNAVQPVYPLWHRAASVAAGRWIFAVALLGFSTAMAQEDAKIDPLVRVVDLDAGETQSVELSNGQWVEVKLLKVTPQRDQVMGALRQVTVDVEVDGQAQSLVCGLYRLPVAVGKVQIDCPVTADYNRDSHIDHWGIAKDARLRLWAAGSPWVRPGTFVYPVGQAWFASQTWFSNEAVSERPDGKFYYHSGLDIGGAENLVPVLAATDGEVVAVGDLAAEDLPKTAVQPRYDVVYLRDDRGWYYRYSHLSSISTPVRLGHRVQAGQQIGTIGKEGGSGGWSHLHFEIKSLQPSGRWGTQDGYAMLWQAYLQQYRPSVIAVARPRHLVLTGESVTLDAARSWAASGGLDYRWTFTDGGTHTGPTVDRVYDAPGTYSEIVEVKDRDGNRDRDFAIVKVVARDNPDVSPPGVHPVYWPTFDLQPGDPITFLVRARNTVEGVDVWDFGDGSAKVTVRSNTDPDSHAANGYAATLHRYSKPGRYLVEVRRETAAGTAIGHLAVVVGP